MARGITFLAAVNKVLVRLRESEVTTFNQTAYSTLISEFVQLTRREIEAAWRWQDLRQTFTVNTVATTAGYDLAGTDERVQILDMYRTVSGSRTWMTPVTWQWMNENYFGQTAQSGKPTEYTPNGISAAGLFTFDVYPLPDAAYELKVNVYAPQVDATAGADIVYAPRSPLIEGALAMAYAERGEDGGQGSLNQQQVYQSALSDAIAVDANQQPNDLLWMAY